LVAGNRGHRDAWGAGGEKGGRSAGRPSYRRWCQPAREGRGEKGEREPLAPGGTPTVQNSVPGNPTVLARAEGLSPRAGRKTTQRKTKTPRPPGDSRVGWHEALDPNPKELPGKAGVLGGSALPRGYPEGLPGRQGVLGGSALPRGYPEGLPGRQGVLAHARLFPVLMQSVDFCETSPVQASLGPSGAFIAAHIRGKAFYFIFVFIFYFLCLFLF